MENLWNRKDMEKELCFTQMEEYIKDNGKIILSMAKDMKNSIMVLSMMDLIKKVSLKDMADIHGIMVNLMKGNGLME